MKAMRIVAGTYEGFCYGWESAVETGPSGAALGASATKGIKEASQPSPTSTGDSSQQLSLIFGYNVHVGCMKSVAMATSGTRAGQLLVTGGTDERVRIYDLRDRTELGELQQHNGVCARCLVRCTRIPCGCCLLLYCCLLCHTNRSSWSTDTEIQRQYVSVS